MSRYIDADEAIRQIYNFYTNAERVKMFNFTPNVIKQTVADIINDIPTVEVKPIVYGEWIIHKTYQGGIEEDWFQCSKCGWENALLIPRNFCPKCGVIMKKKSEEQE